MIQILNLPPKIVYSYDSIFPLEMANAEDCQGTFEAVLGPFVTDLNQLEHGVRMFVNNEFVVTRATAVKADNKALHEIIGSLGGGARHFCSQ